MTAADILSRWPEIRRRCAVLGLTPELRDGVLVLIVDDPAKLLGYAWPEVERPDLTA